MPNHPREPDAAQKKYLATSEVARLWGVHVKTVRAAVSRGELPGFMVSGRLRIPRADAENWGRPVPTAGVPPRRGGEPR